MYAWLLRSSRRVLGSGRRSSLSRAITFLSDDYDVSGYGMWWELFNMNHKVILTGWVLLIVSPEQARVLVRDTRLKLVSTQTSALSTI